MSASTASVARIARRASTRVGALLMLGVVLGAVPVAMGQEAPPPGPARRLAPSVTVGGSGTAAGRPDTAEVTAGVITQSPTAGQALAQNTAGMEKLLKAVTGLGIADKDVQTINVSVNPQRRQGRQDVQPPEILGYEVSNQIRVTVRDLKILGRLLDELVGQGANALGGIRFSVNDPTPLLDQARTQAMADARRKAEVYAAAAGVKLGRVLSIRESAPGVARFESVRMQAMTAVPVAPGEQEFQASVSVTYAIR
jgi:uncharacterized protein YggE